MIVKLLKYFANFPRIVKGILLFFCDLAILGFSMLLAFAVRFDPSSMQYQYKIFSEEVWV